MIFGSGPRGVYPRGARRWPARAVTARPRDATVVHIIARLNVGGAAAQVIDLTASLGARYRTLLVTGHVDVDEVDMRTTTGMRDVDLVDVPELGRAIRPWRDLVAFVRIVKLLRRVRPEIVHTHTAKAGLLGRAAAVITGVPVRVHTFHGHVFHGYFGPLATWFFLTIERVLARITSCIVAVSPKQASELADTYRIAPASRIRAIPYGFDLDRYTNADRPRLREAFRRELDAGERRIVTIVGRLVPIKNHDLFLGAAARVLADGHDALFVIVGGGPEEERLRARAAELGIADDVRFLGWRYDLDRIYAGSDVVALTSLNEGTPVSMIEALAAGCAVVATDVGGVRDVLDGGRLGLLVASNDVDGFADALDRLLRDEPLRRRLAENGPTSARQRYGVERLLDDTAALYTELGAATALHDTLLEQRVGS